MPDPIEELENFTSPGLTMTPMSASEVRRRGTRMRRRNTALATIGGIAAVAVIATPLAVLANQGDKSDLEPAPPTVQWHQTIPAGFPLDEGLPGVPERTDEATIKKIDPCGTIAWSTTVPVATVDVAGASYAGMEDSQSRTLALYEDDVAANRALESIRTGVESCPVSPNGTGEDQKLDLVPSVYGDQSLVFSQRGVDEDGGLSGAMDVFQAVQVGNALLVTSMYGQGGSNDERVAETTQILAANTADVVADMCYFSAEGCGEGDPSTGSDSGAAAATVIPESFDLLAGLPAEGEATDIGRVGPNRDLAPIDLDACGKADPGSGALDQLRADFRQAIGGRERQLMTFPDEDTAQTYVDSVAALYPCTVDGTQGMVGDYQLLGSELGDFGVAAFLRHTIDGEPALGYEIVHVTRVGQAVLLSKVTVDGDSTPVTDAVQAELLDESTAQLTEVVAAMCVFSDAGC